MSLNNVTDFQMKRSKFFSKKIKADGVSLEEDLRGRHGNNAIKLLPEAQKAVADFIFL